MPTPEPLAPPAHATTVLVIEDEPAIRRGICDALGYAGYVPTPCGHGREGLEAALSGRYAVVLLDVMLPGLDGFSICRAIRERLPRQAIMMLILAGVSMLIAAILSMVVVKELD